MTHFDINDDARVIGRYGLTIDAPPDRVWDVLTDFAAWPDWNPAVAQIEIDGPVAPGTRFRWRAGGLPMRSEIRRAEPGRTVGWVGQSPGLSARHIWHLKPRGDETELITEESFDGVLPGLLPRPMRRRLQAALRQGARALQHACELGIYRVS